MADTFLGKIELTKEQFSRIQSIQTGNVKGFKIDDEGITVVTVNDPSPEEQEAIKSALQNLSKAPLQKTRLEEIKEKSKGKVLNLEEVTEILRIHNLV